MLKTYHVCFHYSDRDSVTIDRSGISVENTDYQKFLKLKSRNIIAFYREPFQFRRDGAYYIEMEYASRGSLRQLIDVCFDVSLYLLYFLF